VNAPLPLPLPQHHQALERLLRTAWGLHAAANREPAPHDGAHDIGHVQRVWRNAHRIAAATDEVDDFETLCAAAFLHDLVNYPKDSPRRAMFVQRHCLPVASRHRLPEIS
jgi:HD superfamily phosphodiesterase